MILDSAGLPPRATISQNLRQFRLLAISGDFLSRAVCPIGKRNLPSKNRWGINLQVVPRTLRETERPCRHYPD
jgi:hypothetical protein